MDLFKSNIHVSMMLPTNMLVSNIIVIKITSKNQQKSKLLSWYTLQNKEPNQLVNILDASSLTGVFSASRLHFSQGLVYLHLTARWLEIGPFELKMYIFPIKKWGIFQPAMW